MKQLLDAICFPVMVMFTLWWAILMLMGTSVAYLTTDACTREIDEIGRSVLRGED